MKLFNYKNITITIFSITALASLSAAYYYSKRKIYTAEHILKEVKTYFRKVTGSYIVHQPITLKHINHNQPIYQGGITTYQDGKFVDFEFYADAKSGKVLDIKEL